MGLDKKKRPLDMRTGGDPDFVFDSHRQTITTSTAASTGLGPRGAFAIETTSTGAPVVYTLADPKPGDRLSLMVSAMQSSSDAPIHFNLGNVVGPATSADMITLSTRGSGVSLHALSTARWLTDGNDGASYSTST